MWRAAGPVRQKGHYARGRSGGRHGHAAQVSRGCGGYGGLRRTDCLQPRRAMLSNVKYRNNMFLFFCTHAYMYVPAFIGVDQMRDAYFSNKKMCGFSLNLGEFLPY
jgi:hypothetical protein